MALTKTIEGIDFGETENWTEYDYTGTTCDEESRGLQNIMKVFKPVLYSVIFLLGVAGNGLMISVLLMRWRQLRITEIYLLHLALADLMLLFTISFHAIDSVTGWIFGVFLCKMTGLLTYLNLLSGSFLLACIGFDRYLAIVHAIPSMQSRRPRTVHLTCIVLWLICLGLSLPNTVFLSVAQETTNSSRLSCYYYSHAVIAHNWVLTNRVLHHVCFFLPLAVMSYCYTALVITLCNSQRSHAKKAAIRLALLVTLVFFFCWLPYNIAILIQTMVDLQVIDHETCQSFIALDQVIDATRCLGISHCCLNPFLYAFVGVRFRNEVMRLLCRLGCSRVCLPYSRSLHHYRPSTSDGATSMSTVN